MDYFQTIDYIID